MSDAGLTFLDERSAANSSTRSLRSRAGRGRDRPRRRAVWLVAAGSEELGPPVGRGRVPRDADRDLLTLRHESSDGREFRARLTEVSPNGQWRTQLTVEVPASGTPWVALQVANSEGLWDTGPGTGRLPIGYVEHQGRIHHRIERRPRRPLPRWPAAQVPNDRAAGERERGRHPEASRTDRPPPRCDPNSAQELRPSGSRTAPRRRPDAGRVHLGSSARTAPDRSTGR